MKTGYTSKIKDTTLSKQYFHIKITTYWYKDKNTKIAVLLKFYYNFCNWNSFEPNEELEEILLCGGAPMNLVIRELETNDLDNLPEIDDSFIVNARLILSLSKGNKRIEYTVEDVPSYEKVIYKIKMIMKNGLQ